MATEVNRQWRVARYPAPDEPVNESLFEWCEAPIPEPDNGEFVVETICLATGPAQRGYLTPNRGDFFETVPLGDVMRGRGVGRICASRHPDYRTGELFVGSLGWQDYSVQRPRGAEFIWSTRKVMRRIRPLSMSLGILGQAGATAYFGLLEAGRIQAGDEVLVSAAAGGVGSAAVQIARIRGAGRVVGITGREEKARWLIDELGCDAVINYKSEDVATRISELFPNGIDLFFDNVGGAILDAALSHLAMHARVAVCGFVSTDYAPELSPGPINYRHLVAKRARMQGFIVFDYWERFDEAEQRLLQWYDDGLLVNTDDVDEGLQRMPDVLASLFTGRNRGVKLCRLRPDPD